MRVYFEKPRTTVGWKGLINDPHLDGTFDIAARACASRAGSCSTSPSSACPPAPRLLDPIMPQYIADLITWTAIGARTTESQTHREMASGLSMPVGFKNGTDGNLAVAVNAMISARHPHSFLGIDAEGALCVIHTTGNRDAHLVLRGGAGPNYDADPDAPDEEALRRRGCRARSGRLLARQHRQGPRRQPMVFSDVIHQVIAGNGSIVGRCSRATSSGATSRWPSAPSCGTASRSPTPASTGRRPRERRANAGEAKQSAPFLIARSTQGVVAP